MTILRIVTILNVASLGATLSVPLAWAQTAANTGGLQVNIRDLQGQPVSGATVRYMRIPKTVTIANTRASTREVPASGEATVHGEIAADANGALSVPGLPAGSYSLCASVPSAAYLDPCVWQQPIIVAVSASATTAQTLVLGRGAFLNVRVNDPQGLLPQVIDGLWTPRRLSLGVVYASGAYQAAQNTSVDPAGRDYQLIVPAGVPLVLRLFSHDVALADQNGAAVDMSGSRIAFQAAAGVDQAFTFSVTGAVAR
jgi:hypothetical protein